jgi:hypothetical protein
LSEDGFGAGEPNELRVLIERDSDGACLLGEGFEDGLSDPPDGVRDELDALIWIELSNRLEQPFISDGDELTEIESMALVLLHVRDDEAQICRYQSFRSFFVSFLGPSSEASLLLGVIDQWKFLNVL